MTRISHEVQVEMREALMRAYREVAPGCPTQYVAWIRTVRHCAPRYYVTWRVAYGILAPALRGDRSRLERLRPHRRRMYEELERVVLGMSQEPGYVGKSLCALCREAVRRPAPEFYVSWESFRRIFRNVRRHGVGFRWDEVRGGV